MLCGKSETRSATRILLVEDDAPTLEILSQFLGKFYLVSACSSGEMALEYLYLRADIEIVVTDLRMPGVNGYILTRAVNEFCRRSGRVIPVVMVTGHGTPDDEQNAKSLGVKCFLRKPIDVRELQRVVERCLDRPKAQSRQEENEI
jgi:CheY-like chemotaxis protein